MTLATDLFVAGAFRPAPLPAPSAVDTTGAYRAELSARRRRRGRGGRRCEYALSRGGRPLAGVEPYLGADGHLVALREGDLAYLHVHPEESDTPGHDPLRAPSCRRRAATACSCSSSTTGACTTVAAHACEVTR